jgi:hypothetical protein
MDRFRKTVCDYEMNASGGDFKKKGDLQGFSSFHSPSA